MDPKFLARVQAAGWVIRQVETEKVWCGCPRAGCNLRFQISKGGHIPSICHPEDALPVIWCDSFINDARPALRERREMLGLTIKDAEDCSGIAGDHLAKFEKDEPSKIPNILTFIDLCNSLGYRVALHPVGLPQVTLGRIADTREALDRRKASFRHFGRFRKGRGAAALPKP